METSVCRACGSPLTVMEPESLLCVNSACEWFWQENTPSKPAPQVISVDPISSDESVQGL